MAQENIHVDFYYLQLHQNPLHRVHAVCIPLSNTST